jgi:hypothetical protein
MRPARASRARAVSAASSIKADVDSLAIEVLERLGGLVVVGAIERRMVGARRAIPRKLFRRRRAAAPAGQ